MNIMQRIFNEVTGTTCYMFKLIAQTVAEFEKVADNQFAINFTNLKRPQGGGTK